jgi:chemotaxis protein CheX
MEQDRTIQREKMVQIVRDVTESVFSTMLSLPAVPLESNQAKGDPAPVNGVVAFVSIGGTWTGAGRLYCSSELACKLAGALLMSEYSQVDDEVLDAMAEVSNMIIGNLKTTLEETLGSLSLGVPTVIYGRNYQARTASVPEWTVVPFQVGDAILEIHFSLVPTQGIPQVRANRLEPAMA